jgi:two-component system sensor kinase FixL
MSQLNARPADATRQLQDRLMHVSRLAAIGEMAAGVAHELNQPLAAVANYAQACERLLGQANPDLEEVRDALRQITAQAVRAGDIISRLRGLTRARESIGEVSDVNGLIRELADLIESDARAHGSRWRIELTEGLDPLSLDRAQIQQVVSTARAPDGDVLIAVSDNGPGISPEIAPRLFDPFCTTKPAGTGLGLASSRTIARAHGGTLDYRPDGPGACFVLCLPPAGRR